MGTARADTAKPTYGTWGFDTAGEDRSVVPGDNFFLFANGTWLEKTPIPPDKPGISLRLLMTDTIDARLHSLLETAAAQAPVQPQDVNGKVGAFYKSFMDEARIESLGDKPIQSELDAVRAAKTHDAQTRLMGRNGGDFFFPIFAAYPGLDLKDTTRYTVYLGQAGLGLPDRDYYLSAQFASTKAAYTSYAAQLLQMIDWPQAAARAKDIVDFETKIAEVSWTQAEDRDIAKTYNPMTVAELQTLTPGFAWNEYLKAAGLGNVANVVVGEKSAFPKIAAVYGATPLEVIMAWQAFHVADGAAFYLSKPFADAYFNLHEKTLEGQSAQRPRWKRGVFAVAGGDCGDCFGTLNWAVGQIYVAKYFPPESKAKIEDLVMHVKAAYRKRLENNEWMSPQTKAEAIKKLDTYRVKVGYPDKWRDYSKVIIRSDDLIGNVRNAAAGSWAFQTARLAGPVDVDDWGMTPQTNDAYNGQLRDIVFPAGILQAPIFDPNADPAVNYGAIGAVIGHEMTHGFDDQGRKIDASGALNDWWSSQDAANFESRAGRLGRQYSQFEPVAGVHINGDLTMGENIADLGGLTLGLDAYRASLNGKPAPVIGGYTGDQRVFLGWAQAWRGKFTDDYVRKQISSDPHSPREFRTNGVVRNIDAWYEAFGVKPGDKLYVAPAARVRIW